MTLHRLSSFIYQVPEVAEVISYYTEFGLTDNGDGSLATVDGGTQLHIEQGPYRRISAIELGADDPDDLARIASSLTALGIDSVLDQNRLVTTEPIMGLRVEVVVQDRVAQTTVPRAPVNGTGSRCSRDVEALGQGREPGTGWSGHPLLGAANASVCGSLTGRDQPRARRVHPPSSHLCAHAELECDLVVGRLTPGKRLGSLEGDQELAADLGGFLLLDLVRQTAATLVDKARPELVLTDNVGEFVSHRRSPPSVRV